MGAAGAAVRGFAWGTSANLSGGDTATTTDSSGTPLGTGATFTSSLSSLSCGTTYYSRAYASSTYGDGLGTTQSFTTSACSSQNNNNNNTPITSNTTSSGSIAPITIGSFHPDLLLNPITNPVTTVPTLTLRLQTPAIPRGLRQGSVGSDVTNLQSFLEEKGLLTMPRGVAKGTFGPLTKTALMTYQRSQGLDQTGAVGPLTEAAITAGQGTPVTSAPLSTTSSVPTQNLSLHASGASVTQLQQFLNASGATLPTTGYFGLQTYTALVTFQRAHNLPATGYYGPMTRAYLKTH